MHRYVFYELLLLQENLERVARDLESGLYGKYYFNFISPISRQKLEDLAAKALQSSTVAQVIIISRIFCVWIFCDIISLIFVSRLKKFLINSCILLVLNIQCSLSDIKQITVLRTIFHSIP